MMTARHWIVTRKDRRNVVMMSEEAYNNLMENLYIRESQANYEWLMESKQQLETGKVSAHPLIEAESNE